VVAERRARELAEAMVAAATDDVAVLSQHAAADRDCKLAAVRAEAANHRSRCAASRWRGHCILLLRHSMSTWATRVSEERTQRTEKALQRRIEARRTQFGVWRKANSVMAAWRWLALEHQWFDAETGADSHHPPESTRDAGMPSNFSLYLECQRAPDDDQLTPVANGVGRAAPTLLDKPDGEEPSLPGAARQYPGHRSAQAPTQYTLTAESQRTDTIVLPTAVSAAPGRAISVRDSRRAVADIKAVSGATLALECPKHTAAVTTIA
jgi:hypothetical protein